jgi:hypothetical protein
MPLYHEKCPMCRQPTYFGGVNPAIVTAVAKPISDLGTKITDAASQAAQRNYEKKQKIGFYEREKERRTLQYYNQLKKQRKQGKLPPSLRTDEQLWEYAQSQGSGLFYTNYDPENDYSSSEYSSEGESSEDEY